MSSNDGKTRSRSSPEKDVAELRRSLSTKPDDPHRSSNAAMSVICYCLASITMTLVNKFVVSGTDFSMTFLLLCMQSVVCSAVVYLCKRFGVISIRDFDVQDARAWAPISFLLVWVIYTGSKSLQFLSIPVYTIFKNLTIILIAYGEVIWFGGRVTKLSFLSFILMILSSMIAASSDIAVYNQGILIVYNEGFSLGRMAGMFGEANVGYMWMLINCLCSAAYVLSMRKRIKSTGFSDWDSMFYNNLLSVPMLALFSIIIEDWRIENLIRNFPPETRSKLLSAIAFSGAAAVGISYTTAWCVRVTSSTTYSMTGALNKLPVALSGMLFFGDPVTSGSVCAIALGFLAGLLYAIAKNNQKKAESARPPIPLMFAVY
ncbi:UDP-galactose transporter [Fistulina hepatica ATCC 64428]|uniref:GDP-mannose transporter n=1 Tax=Fistulina hepatica ATCC 64428 TaxID=1128425 RepID=A0A0D7ANM9_9AGAR|nr:UDP-galactose transporter [Fistulina hepatica ATCC 64428]